MMMRKPIRSLPSMPSTSVSFVLLVTLAAARVASGQTPPPQPTPALQNPSPMVEQTRVHERLAPRKLDGATRTFSGPAGKPVELFVANGAANRSELELVVHFLGA